jgi:hypothetical protein
MHTSGNAAQHQMVAATMEAAQEATLVATTRVATTISLAVGLLPTSLSHLCLQR